MAPSPRISTTGGIIKPVDEIAPRRKNRRASGNRGKDFHPVYHQELGNEKAKEDEMWYYVEEETFLASGAKDQRRIHQLGEMLFTTKGVEAEVPCEQCVRQETTCMVYSQEARADGSNMPKACAFCYFKGKRGCDTTMVVLPEHATSEHQDGCECSQLRAEVTAMKVQIGEMQDQLKEQEKEQLRFEEKLRKLESFADPDSYR